MVTERTRRDMISKAAIECLDEMYQRSQPSITWNEIVSIAKENPNRSVWQEHYLPQWLYTDIQEKYMNMYKISSDWGAHVELVKKYLIEGGTKDKYIPERIDKSGFKHPGYRGYEDIPSISVKINDIITKHYGRVEPGQNHLVKKIVDAVMENVKDCEQFFNTNREEIGFRMDVGNYSPNSNIEAVREFYKNDPHIKIHDIEKEKFY